MKILVYLSIIMNLCITGCSQKEDEQKQALDIIEYNAGVGITTASGDFGTIQPNNIKVVTYSIKNTGDSALVGHPSIDNSNFSIIYQSGCSSILPTKSCLLKVAFDAKGKVPGIYESNLNLDNFFIGLSASIPAPPVVDPLIAKARFQALSSSTAAITELDLGTINQTQSIVKTVYLKNIGTQTLNSVIVAPVNYALIYDSCSNKNIAVGGNCYFKLSLSGAGKSGSQNAIATYGGESLNLIASVLAPNQLPPAVTPNPNIDYLLSNTVVTSVNYGEIAQDSSKTQTITLKNTGNISLNNTVNMSGTDYSLIYDNCSSKNLAVGATCPIKVSFSGSGKSGSILGSLTYEGKSLNLSSIVVTPSAPSPTLFPDSKFLVNNVESTAIDLGLIAYNNSQQIIFNIKNTGTLNDSPKTATINNSNFVIGYNQCVNKSLTVNETCQVRVIFSSNGKSNGVYNSVLSFGDKTHNLAASVGVVFSYEPIYSAYGTCSAELACSGVGSQSRIMEGCQKLANGAPVEGGLLSDCSSFNVPSNLSQSCNSPAGNILANITGGVQTYSCLEGSGSQSFVSVSCDANFHSQGQICEADVITYNPVYSGFGSCSVSQACDGEGIKTQTITDCRLVRNGVDESSSALSNCSAYNIPGYLNEPCQSPAGQITLAVDNGNKTVSCLIGSNVQSFISLSCDSNYFVNGQVCSPDVITYNPYYSAYGTCSSINICSGQGQKSRNLNDCKQVRNGLEESSVSLSNCSSFEVPTNLTLSCNSPAGNILNNITGGVQTLSCLEGSSTQSFVSVSCDSGYEQSGQICAAVSFQPVYSGLYSTCSASLACDGIGSQSAPIASCQKLLGGSPVAGGQLSDCSSFSQTTMQSCNSPAGISIEDIIGGSLNYTCSAGQYKNQVNPLVLCFWGSYYADQNNQLCNNVSTPPTLGANISGFNGDIESMSVQTDGKILVGGNFTTYNGTTRNRIARINTDGSLDTTFDPGAGSLTSISDIAIQTDGKILISGGFATYNGTARNRIARINTNGTLDTTFNPGTGLSSAARDINIQPDGKILVGGNFTTYNGTARNRIARINTDGTLDTTFDPGAGPSSQIVKMVIQSDLKILILGEFITYDGIARSRVARINPNGTLDTSFSVGTGLIGSGGYNAVFQSDGKIILAGFFSSYNGTSRNNLVRVDPTGLIDNTFNPGSGTNNYIQDLKIQSDGKIVIVGNFTTYNGTTRNRMARINSDGSLDATFNPGAGGLINRVEIQSDSSFLIAGIFNSVGGFSINKYSKLDSSGNFAKLTGSTIQYSGASQLIQKITIQNDSKILIGGTYPYYNGRFVNNITRLNTDGSSDVKYGLLVGPNDYIMDIKVQSDGKHIVSGNFTTYNGVTRNRIARINTDGSLDTTFNPGTGPSAAVNMMAIQSDGKIIIAGLFTNYNGTSKPRIARLNTDGTIDNSFSIGTGLDNLVNAIAIQSDGKVLVSGNFTTYNSVAAVRLIRLNTDGSLDSSFNIGTGPNSAGNKVAVQSDGKIIFTGGFSTYNGVSRTGIVRLNSDGTADTSFNSGTGAVGGATQSLLISSSGKILIGGSFTTYNGTTRNRIARINTDGSIDTSFNPGTGANQPVLDIAEQSDGKIILGGQFTNYNGTLFDYITRINQDGTLSP